MMSVLKKKKDFISKLRHHFQDARHPKWLEFMTTFFESAPSSAFEGIAADLQLSNQLKSAWSFFVDRDSQDISIFYELDEIQGRLMLHVLQPDQPFLLETLKTHLTAHRLFAEEVFHPIFSVKRNESGKLEDFAPNRSDPHYAFESLISLNFNWTLPKRNVTQFIDELRWRFSILQVSINDWPRMRQYIQKLIPKVQHPEWDYLEWMLQDNFIFVGYREVQLQKKHQKYKYTTVENSQLGVFHDVAFNENPAIEVKLHPGAQGKFLFNVRKTPVRSPINRSARLDSIEIADKKGDKVHQIIGIFTQRSYTASVFKIPILKRKAERIFEHFGLQRNWHDGKTLIKALESIPHDELWSFSEEELTELCGKAIGFHERSLPSFIYKDSKDTVSITLLTFVGRERYSIDLKERIALKLVETFGGTVSSTRGIIDGAPFARLIHVIDQPTTNFTNDALDKLLTECSLTWDERRLRISQKNPLRDTFMGVFTKEYQHDFSPDQAVMDSEILNSLGIRSNFGIVFDVSEDILDATFASHISLRIFSLNRPIQLSYLLNVLDNFGLKIAQEKTYALKNSLYYLHHCLGVFVDDALIFKNVNIENLQGQIEKTLHEDHPNDIFNRLYTSCQMQPRQVQLFRALQSYLRQILYIYAESFVVSTLCENQKLTSIIVQIFEERFDNNLSSDQRNKNFSALKREFNKLLESVTDPAKDQLFRDLFEVINASVRSNYFLDKDVVSIKFDCAKLRKLPHPRPLFETFVFAPHIEGVHLRTSRVARGGVRHSDRLLDYRTEVLQLMQAQNLKNAIIVPTGAKAGFVVKKRNASKEQIIECYKDFIRGILDLADNQKDGKVVHPKGLVVHDENDPYVVVAADKGTATYSDMANDIALDYDFWLGDAFASGGSHGYDHKQLGITAKGAFVSVEHHFHKLGVSLNKDVINVVGVGDMSGDVFGNGMILHPNLCLLATFNHKHIFIDPSPDLQNAFMERKRLFETPGSQWNDYTTDLISKGGGVFSRFEKVLTVSREIQDLLGVEEKVSPDALMRAILSMKADLLWFGGIGTFICGSEETFSGDANNDAIRVPASSISAKVIGEGANLGVTALARIELGRKGILINSDAIDNAGGVNCSDHEVNLKILIGTRADEKRDTLLQNLTEDVVNHVLFDNKSQNIALDIMQSQAIDKHKTYCELINYFEKEGLLNRKTVAIEKADVLLEQRSSLTRSEFAILLSYSKIALQKIILDNFQDFSPFASAFVAQYFPKKLHGQYVFENHLLFKDISALCMTNAAINFMGPLWYFEYPDHAVERAKLFVTLYKSWGLQKQIHTILNKHSAQVTGRLNDLREVLTKSLPFVSEKGVQDFSYALKAFKQEMGNALDFNDYPYLLGFAGSQHTLSMRRFFYLLKEAQLSDLYEIIFSLPVEEVWQVRQKEKLLRELFERHLDLCKENNVENDLQIREKMKILSSKEKNDYAYISFFMGEF